MKKITFVACLIVAGVNAQTNNKQMAPQNGNVTVVRKTNTACSYERKINGKTVQFFTQEQFDKLPADRKSHYLAHKEQYQIIANPKK